MAKEVTSDYDAPGQTAVSVPVSNESLGHEPWLLALVLVGATFVAYWPALSGTFVWDDDSWTTGCSRLLRDLSGLRSIWCQPTALQQYYPLTATTFWLDYHLWGFWPLPYHVENILLHVLAALLFWKLLSRLEVPGAWLAAAIFAVHPVMVESAAWITERKNVLSLALYLGALLVYGRWTLFWKAEADSRRCATRCSTHWGGYLLAWLLALGALLAKTTAISLPAVILLLCWWKRGRIRWRADVLPTVPFFALAVGLGLTTAWLERTHVGANGPEWAIPFPERCLIAGRALGFYTGKLLWPANLCFVYPRWQLDAHSLRQWLYPCIAGGTVLGLWAASNRIGRGPAVAALFFLGTLFPVLGFMNAYFMRYSFVCDHWVYLPSLGPIALAAAGIATSFKWSRRRPSVLESTACGTLLLVLATLTWRQAHIYPDSETLWRDTLTKNPQCWMAHNNLGATLSSQHHLREAIQHLNEAVRIKPDYAEAHCNLGYILMGEGRMPEAIERFRQGLRINPRYAKAHCDLGWALQQSGNIDEAVAEYTQALNIKPNLSEAHNDLGTILLQQGKVNDALIQFEDALRSDPDNAEAWYNAGLALARLGRMREAQQHWQQALQINPDYPEAHYSLGIISQQAGQTQDAIAQYEKAVRGKPDYWQAHYNLAIALGKTGNIQEAEVHLEQALRIKPDFTPARDALARLHPH